MGLTLLLQACAAAPRFTDNPKWMRVSRIDPKGDFRVGQTWIGTATFYGAERHGLKTASGTVFDMNGITAAHRYLPFGSVIKVVNLKNNKSCDLRITDRGPFVKGRILDVSLGAAERLGMVGGGLVEVQITIISLGPP